MPLVAEGIETKEMGDRLTEMGCEMAQGYFYGRPTPFADWEIDAGEIKLQISSD